MSATPKHKKTHLKFRGFHPTLRYYVFAVRRGGCRTTVMVTPEAYWHSGVLVDHLMKEAAKCCGVHAHP